MRNPRKSLDVKPGKRTVKNKSDGPTHSRPRRRANGTPIPRVALCIRLDSTYGRDKLSGILAYLRRNPRWDIPLVVNNMPCMSPGELKRWRGDGVIGEFYTTRQVESVAALGIPMVNTVDVIASSPIPGVYIDESSVGKLAAEHLLILQRSVVLYFECKNLYYSRKRYHCFQEEILSRGGRLEVHWMKDHPDLGQLTDRSSYLQALKRHTEPIAVFAATDRIALEVVRACHELNRKIPEEVAILGCGNDEIICQIAQPQLSSINLKTQEVGFRAAELLDQLMGRGAPGETSSHFAGNQEIIVRGSSDRYSLVNKDVAAAMQYIRAHSNEAIYVPDVVHASGVSRRKLEVLFHKHVGRGIYQEIRSSHIAIARRLLTSTTLPLSEICRRSGFNNVSALEWAISQSEGCTAGELRAKHAAP